MDLKRAKELLKAMIDDLHIAERNDTVIEKLLNIGFTKEELINEFDYCEDDVEDVLLEMIETEEE